MRQPLLKNEIRIKLAKKYLKNGNKHVWKTKGTITPGLRNTYKYNLNFCL